MSSATALPEPSSTARSSTDPAELIARRFPSGRDLTRPELRAAAAAIAADDTCWRSQVRHDPNERVYVQLYRDPHVDIWLICWTNQQDTGYHDHDLSSGAVQVVEGHLVEDRFELYDGFLRETSQLHRAGAAFDFDASYVHRLRHDQGPRATSLHLYSPALWRMGHYDTDPAGLLRRKSVSYAEELVPTSPPPADTPPRQPRH